MSPKKGKVAGNSIATTTKKIAVAKKRDSARPGRISYPIVAIGASAGGFEAFNRLLRALSEDPKLALVFIMEDWNHLPLQDRAEVDEHVAAGLIPYVCAQRGHVFFVMSKDVQAASELPVFVQNTA